MAFEELTGGNMIWKPEQADEQLTGEIIDADEGEYGPYVIIQSEDDDIDYQTPGHAALRKKIKRLKVGERVRITFLGLVVSETTGNEYNDYKVEVDR